MASNQANCRQILNRSRSDDDIETNLTPKMKKPRQTHSLPITPQKQLNKSFSLEDPLTPTTNLKMLVSAAFGMASEQNEGKQKRELFNDDDFQEDSCSTVSDSVEDKDKIECSQEFVDDKKFFDLGSGRKMKSLGLLCQKFLSKYPEGTEGTIINLHEVAKELNVERRRIYDIVNVLESLEYVTKKGKNTYIWHGSERLVPILSKLKALAIKIYGSDATDSNDELFFETENNSKFNVTIPSLWLRNGILVGNQEVEFSDSNNNASSKQDEASKRRNKSLGIFCQKLIMLFMVSKDQTIALEDAAREVIEVSEDPVRQNKTKVRRLYDIANILTSMDLIQKTVTYAGSRKAAFTWIGVDLDDIVPDTETLEITLNGSDKNTSINNKQSLLSYPPTKHSLFRQTAEKIEGLKRGMSSVRKMESRSMSANNIVLQKKNKMPRTKSAAVISRKRSSTDIDQGDREGNSSKEAKREIKARPKKDGRKDEVVINQEQNVEELTLVATPKKTQEFNHDFISPDERCFREEIKRLQERFPNKLQNTDGLLTLLNAHDELQRSSGERSEWRDAKTDEKGSRRCLLERLRSERQCGGEDLRGVKGASVVEMCTQLGSRKSSNGPKEQSQKGLSISCLETIIDQVKGGTSATLRDEIEKVVGMRNMFQYQGRIDSVKNNSSGCYGAEMTPSWQRYPYHVTTNVQKTSVGVQTSDTSPLKPSTIIRKRRNTDEVSSVASQTDLSDQKTESCVIKSPGKNVVANSPVSPPSSQIGATSSLVNQASGKTPVKSPGSYFLVGLKQRSPNSPNRSFISSAITSLKSGDVTPVKLATTMSAINNSNILKPSRLDNVPAISQRDGVIKMVPIPPTPFNLPTSQAEKENYQRFLTPAVTPGKTSPQLTMQGARILLPFNLFNTGAEKLSPPPAQIPKVMPGLEETPMRDDIQDMLTKRSQRNISLLSSKES